MATAGKLEYLISIDSSQLNSGLNSAEGKVKGFGNRLSTWAVAKGQILGRLIEQAGKVTFNFVKSSIQESSNFNKSMSQVAATLGKSVTEIKQLSDFARKMGAETAFTAEEAAQGLNYMALAGYTAEKSMKMLPTVLNLAAAGNMELARASDMVTDAESALGLTTEGTEALIDQMAMTASKSNTSVEMLGDAILTVGGTAKMMGEETEMLNATLGILADNGIKGAEGGTALRNVLLSLSAPTDKANKQLKKLGVQVFDAEGNMRSMEDIMLDMGNAMKDMTSEQRTSILNDIFNKRDLKSVEALLGTTQDRWEELLTSISGAKGSAAKMAETQLDNLAGDATKFKSALGEAKIALVEGLTPTLRRLTQTGTRFVQKLTDAFKKKGLRGAIEEAGKIFSKFVTNLKNSDNPVLQKIGSALEFVKNIGQEVWGLITDFPNKIKEWKESDSPGLNALSSVLSTVDELIKGVETAFNEGLPAAIEQFKSSDDPFVSFVGGGLQVAYDILTWIVDKSGSVENAIRNIAIAFSLIKIAPAVTTFIANLLALSGNTSFLSRLFGTGTTTTTAKNSGGFIKGKLLTGLNSFSLTNGAVLADWASHTNLGMSAINSLAELFGLDRPNATVGNLGDWVEEKKSEIEENVNNFDKDLRENKLTKWAVELGENAIRFWDQFWNGNNPVYTPENAEQADWRPSYMKDQKPEEVPPVEVPTKPDEASLKKTKEEIEAEAEKMGVTVPVYIKMMGYDPNEEPQGGLAPFGQAKGNWTVPYDNYPSLLHRGEMVLNKSQARQLRDGEFGGGASVGEMVSASVEKAMSKVYVMLNGNKVGDLTSKRINKNINATTYSKLRAMGG